MPNISQDVQTRGTVEADKIITSSWIVEYICKQKCVLMLKITKSWIICERRNILLYKMIICERSNILLHKMHVDGGIC